MKHRSVKQIAILTSGGDAPGMNAAIRSAVRYANYYGIETYGILRGYQGLIENEFVLLGPRNVSNTIQRGGTILKTSRSKEFRTRRGLLRAKDNLVAHEIDGLVVIGGDGTYHGAIDLGKIWNGRIVGVPGTIVNDLYGTDATIGYDTAVNTALESIDKIRDTADSHERIFLVEVMGRHSGFIALEVGISGGSEEVLIPEKRTNVSEIRKHLGWGKKKGKMSSIIVVAEGAKEGNAMAVSKKLSQLGEKRHRVVVLGHVQRGGSPTAADRVLATELGAFAVSEIKRGKSGVAVGKSNGKLISVSFSEACKRKKKLESRLLNLLPILAT